MYFGEHNGMNWYHLYKLAAETYLQRWYHGTDAKNLPSILIQGIRLSTVSTWGGFSYNKPSLFLTPDIQTAARYAVGIDTFLGGYADGAVPAVLEIDLYMGPKRIKDTDHDISDRLEDPGSASRDDQEFSKLSSAIEIFADKTLGLQYKIPDIKNLIAQEGKHRNNSGNEGMTSLDGFDLYGFLMRLARRGLGANFGQYKDRILKNIHSTFPKGGFSDSLTITDSGTVRVSKQYLSSREQFRYFKSIPPTAIKAVWVRKSEFPSAQGQGSTMGQRELPSETRQSLRNLVLIYERIQGKDPDSGVLGIIVSADSAAQFYHDCETYGKLLRELDPQSPLIPLLDQGAQIDTAKNEQSRRGLSNQVNSMAAVQEAECLKRSEFMAVKNQSDWVRLDKNDPQLSLLMKSFG